MTILISSPQGGVYRSHFRQSFRGRNPLALQHKLPSRKKTQEQVREKMDKNHRQLLLKARLELVEDLDANCISSFLYAEEILSKNDLELIQAEVTSMAKAELLLDILPRKGPKAFGKFIAGLQMNEGSKHLAEMLLDLSGEEEDETDSPSMVFAKAEHGKIQTETRYAMNNKPHGVCLIINNKDFLGELPQRVGSDVDAQNLRELFTSLNFTVELVNNATGKKMKEKIRDIANLDHSSTDCVVVCLLSHGVYQGIYASDSELLNITNLLQPLIMCERTLLEKPRLFFIQACRVQKKATIKRQIADDERAKLNSYEVTVHFDDLKHSSTDTPEAVLPSSLLAEEIETPSQANILIAYSTVPGEEAWRNAKTGSWFIHAVCCIFKTSSKEQDVSSMISMACNTVSKRTSSVSGAKQIPITVSTMTKKLFFRT